MFSENRLAAFKVGPGASLTLGLAVACSGLGGEVRAAPFALADAPQSASPPPVEQVQTPQAGLPEPAPDAQTAQSFCVERPGQTTPPCVVMPGKAMLELTIVGRARSRSAGSVDRTLIFGDTTVRVGVIPRLEVEVGWTAYGRTRTRDRQTGAVNKTHRTGDLSFGFLYGFTGNDGPIAIQGFVSAPTGKQPIGDGAWEGGVRLPVAIAITDKLQFGLTPEIDRSANDSGSGHHWVYGGAFGVSYPLSDKVSLSADLSVFRNKDPEPSARLTKRTFSTAIAWQINDKTQLDFGVLQGLYSGNRRPAMYLGIARQF